MSSLSHVTGEVSDSKVAAIFDSERRARRIAHLLRRSLRLKQSQVQVISGQDRHPGRKLEPEDRGIFRTMLVAHAKLGLVGLVVGAVLIHAAKAPNLISREDLKTMKPGAVIVDVAIDQGGCVETARATTHSSPTYIVDGIVHYCVANMPGAVGRTSTQALTNATLPWVLKIARHGAQSLAEKDRWFRPAINMDRGRLYNAPVAEAHGLELVSA